MWVIQFKNIVECRRIHFVWAGPSFCYITFSSLQRKQYFYATNISYIEEYRECFWEFTDILSIIALFLSLPHSDS